LYILWPLPVRASLCAKAGATSVNSQATMAFDLPSPDPLAPCSSAEDTFLSRAELAFNAWTWVRRQTVGLKIKL
jgi:hypothetical protein